ncbi:MAG: thermonuclease family protein [Chloroflexota bacterium]
MTEQVDYGIVLWVKDGNILVVNIRGWFYSVRYLGVDASVQATKVSKSMLLGQVVKLVRDEQDTDQFGQLLRYVLLGEDRFINFELVRHGLARYDDSLDAACGATLRQAQQFAQGQEIGLWAPVTETTVPLTIVFTQPTPATSTITSTNATGVTGSATHTLSVTLTPTLTVTQTVEASSTVTISSTISTATTLTPTSSPTLTQTATP